MTTNENQPDAGRGVNAASYIIVLAATFALVVAAIWCTVILVCAKKRYARSPYPASDPRSPSCQATIASTLGHAFDALTLPSSGENAQPFAAGAQAVQRSPRAKRGQLKTGMRPDRMGLGAQDKFRQGACTVADTLTWDDE